MQQVIDENACQTNEAVSLTNCWSWDPTWLMRLPGKQMKQCHSLAVSHGIQHDWWKCLANKWSSSTHLLLVMGCNMIDENAWQTSLGEAVSLTCWCSWSTTWLIRLRGKQMKESHSLAVVMGSNIIDQTAWWRNEAVWLTSCWSCDATWLMWMPGKKMKQYPSLAVGHGIQHDW